LRITLIAGRRVLVGGLRILIGRLCVLTGGLRILIGGLCGLTGRLCIGLPARLLRSLSRLRVNAAQSRTSREQHSQERKNAQ
jgi:hypothetical protein